MCHRAKTWYVDYQQDQLDQTKTSKEAELNRIADIHVQ
jgi:hypothetical protein